MADKTEFDINTFSAKLAVELLKMTGKNLVAKSLNDIQTRIVNTYKTYLTNAAKKYGQAKIFFSPNESVKFEDFYVPLSLTTVRKWQTYFIEVSTNSSVFREDNAVLLFGTAGCGKSMLMRHLFLDNLRMGSRIPILLELRDFNDSDDSLEQHLWNALRRLGFKEEISKMEKSLDMGEFTIFLDGFDEIKSSRRTNLMQEISSLIGARPNNRLIISSRYDTSIASWPNFQIFTIQRLTLDKACQVVELLPIDREVKLLFVEDLKRGAFKKQDSFVSNPLLLSILLVTYLDNVSIPTKMTEFYSRAFDALFYRHDARKLGYQRERFTGLSQIEFGDVFSAFCILSYDVREFNFSLGDALEYIKKAKGITGISVDEEKFIRDALLTVNLLIEDGSQISFTHRSFQEYFTASFIYKQKPAIQRRLMERYLDKIEVDIVLSLLQEIDPDAVNSELLIPQLDILISEFGFANGISSDETPLKVC